MELLWLLVFTGLGIILDGIFGSQADQSKPRQPSTWYSKLPDALLRIAVLIGLVICLTRFPLGLLGLIAGAILGWIMFANTPESA